MTGPQFRIRDKVYPVPQNERLGELRLVERVTGITHRELRVRTLEQQQRIAEIEDRDNLTQEQILGLLDDLVMLAQVAQAVQRANPGWSTERVAAFVDALDEGDVQMEGGQEDDEPGPPAGGATSAPPTSPTGTGPAQPSSSDSDTGSSESPTPTSSGTVTSPTSREERLVPAT